MVQSDTTVPHNFIMIRQVAEGFGFALFYAGLMSMIDRIWKEHKNMRIQEILCNRRDENPTAEPPHPQVSKKTLLLRLSLVGKAMTPTAAMGVLNIQPGTYAASHFQLLMDMSKDIRYVYDALHEKEFVIVLHPYRDYIAVYKTTPLYHDPNLGYSVVRLGQFFIDNNFDHILQQEYRRLVAVRRIHRHQTFRSWMEKPVTADGKLGITCRLARRATDVLEEGNRNAM